MKPELFIPQNIPEYLDAFNKRNYAAFFKKYAEKTGEFFASLEQQESLEKIASETVENFNATVKGLWKKRQFCDIEFFLMEYACPAALAYGSEKSSAFARALRDAWGESHPTLKFELADFEKFNDNFNTAIFGVNMNWGGNK